MATSPGCGGGTQGGMPQDMAVPVEMTKAETRPLSEILELVGTLEAHEAVVLKPEIPGKIISIGFRQGAHVKKGELLVALDDRETVAALREAEADLSFARAEYLRRKDLFSQRVVSKQEMERARAEMDRIAARVEVMKARLRKTRIRAPFDGIVGSRLVSPGAFVEPGDALVNFEAVDYLNLNFEVPERYLPGLAVGQIVKVGVVAFPGRTFEGKVYFINPRVSRSSRSVIAKARVDNPDFALRPGMFANTALLIEEKADAIAIPEQSLVPQGDQQFVFRVKDDSTVELVPVKTGIRDAGVVEIVAGLASGDTVVTSGHQKIGPGSKVMPFSALQKQQKGPPAAKGSGKQDGGST
ncbi:MAG: efflux RND transporter periplasmic adaptor subunit [Myxococcota bacterium]